MYSIFLPISLGLADVWFGGGPAWVLSRGAWGEVGFKPVKEGVGPLELAFDRATQIHPSPTPPKGPVGPRDAREFPKPGTATSGG